MPASQATLQAICESVADALGRAITGLRADVQQRMSLLEAEYRARLAEVDSLVANVRVLELTIKSRLGEIRDGTSVSVEDVTPVLTALVDERFAALPKPQDGRSVTVEDLDPVITSRVDVALSAALDARAPAPVVMQAPEFRLPTVDDILPAITPRMEELVSATVAAAIAAVPAPQDGEPGKSVTVDDVKPVIADEVARQLAAVPAPKDGENGRSITVDDVRPLLTELVAEAATTLRTAVTEQIVSGLEERVGPAVATAVAAIPIPKDGADADPAVTEALIDRKLAAAVAALPPAAPGKDADPALVESLVDTKLAAALERIPAPADGKDADPEVTRALVATSVREAVAAIQLPEIDYAAIEARMEERVAATFATIPTPKDGADADPAVIAEQVRAAVEAMPIVTLVREAVESIGIPDLVRAAVADIPKPSDGKDADPEVITAQVRSAVEALAVADLVRDAVSSIGIPDLVRAAVSEIPKPENGKDADPTVIADQVRSAVEALGVPGLVRAAVEQIPVQDMVRAAVAEMPKPENGKDADPQVIVAEVQRAVAALPRAVSAEDLIPAIGEMVQTAVAAIPPAQPGKDADPAETKRMIDEAFAALPKPKDGRDADPAAVREIVVETVREAIAAIPVPERGEPGPKGALGEVVPWEDRVFYQGEVVTFDGAIYQALADTGKKPDTSDWRCIVARGEKGDAGRTPEMRGLYNPATEYRELDIVMLNGSSFGALRDNPGACPGPDWKLVASRGSKGEAVPPKVIPQPPGAVVEAQVSDDGLIKLVNADGTTVEIDLYPVLSKIGGQ